jgi:pimeloyl-ACP methyl ester carboxylesterase
LNTIDVPVLLLWGTMDVILLPRQGRRFERLIPGAELRYIRGVGHVPMSDAPEELAEAITEFALDRPRARPAEPAASVGSGG